MGSHDVKERAPRVDLASLNGVTNKRGPGRPPKIHRAKRGPKPLDLEGVERQLRRVGSAFLDELFPEGEPAGFGINLKTATWRFGRIKPSKGRLNLWCRVRGVTPAEGARQVQDWLQAKATEQPEHHPIIAVRHNGEEAAPKLAPKSFDIGEAELQFRDAAEKRGVKLPLKLNADGKLHRCSTDEDENGDAGAYIWHINGVPAGGFQNWKDGEPWENWHADLGRTLTEAERKAFAERSEKTRLAAEVERFRLAKEVAKKAADIWNRSEPASDAHPYLTNKKIKSVHGLRICNGKLIMPLHDEAGAVHSLQFIDGDGAKLFLTGGRKRGCFYKIGEIDADGDVLIGEGFATMASVHEATGRAAIVALDCGNLLPVAEALQRKYPNAKFIFCADHDAWSKGNPGESKAIAAARAVGGKIAVPEFAGLRSCRETDFNDLANAEDLQAVARCIDAAKAPELSSGSDVGDGAAQTESAPVPLPSGYRFAGGGNIEFLTGQDKDGIDEWNWLSSPIEIAAETSNEDGVEHGKLLRVYDRQNKRWHEWAMPSRLLAGDGNIYRAELFAMGLQMPLTIKARNAFGQLLMTANPPRKIRCVERTGWHGNVFVLPNCVIGRDQEREVVFQSSRPIHAKFRSSGELRDWQDNVAAHAIGNSRLILGICAAFAAPCLKFARQDGGGIHFWGDSSGGKTTTLRVSGSVWGGGGVGGYIDNWSNTINGLEGRALAHSDALLCLQELGQADPDAAADAAYKISNGQGKGRMNRDASLRETPEWRVLFLSDGEITLDDKIREARGNKRRMAGQMVRVIDVEADAGKGLGAFDRVPKGMNGREFSDLLRESSAKYYGKAAPAFLEKLTADVDGVTAYLHDTTNAFVRKFAASAGGQIERVAKRFGLIAAAGELAIEYGILPWPKGEPSAVAKRCFQEWLGKRGATGSIETEQGVDQIRRIIESAG